VGRAAQADLWDWVLKATILVGLGLLISISIRLQAFYPLVRV